MPWKVYQSGDEGFCVHKHNPDGSMGERVSGGCHATREEAEAQMRAMYASESKEMAADVVDILKSIVEDSDPDKPIRMEAVMQEYVSRLEAIQSADPAPEQAAEPDTEKAKRREDISPAEREQAEEEYGDVEYADPTNKKYPIDTAEHVRAAWSYFNMPRNYGKYSAEERSTIRGKIVAAWKKHIDPSGPPSAAKKDLLGKLKQIADAVVTWFKEDEPEVAGVTVWKEGGQYWWLARYSNKFRDNDRPAEIISSDSHRRFVQLVKEGKAAMPELWLWHKKNWKVGQALALAYDELGFAVAIGVFDPGRDAVAEALMTSKERLAVSHGMPYTSLKRDAGDPTIIVEHETREISPLPAWAAANKLTGFVVLNLESKEESMAIPDETKKDWISKLGINPTTLESLEAANAADASKAASEGLESKEAGAEESAQPATQEAPVTVSTTPEAPATPAAEAMSLTVNDLRTAVQEAVTGIVTPVLERVTALEASLKEIKEANIQAVDALKGTPTASLTALLGQFAQSAIGAAETRVDGRTTLAQSKPKEAAANVEGRTFVPFINEMLSGGNQQ